MCGWATVGKRVRIDNKRNGVIRFVGKSELTNEKLYGVCLEESPIRGVPRADDGILLPLNRITPQTFYSEGDRVRLLDGRCGTVRFVGETSFAPDVWYGIELDTATGKNDGSVNGIRYFNCDSMFGVFVKSEKIISVIDTKVSASFSSLPSTESSNFHLNDFVGTTTGKSGHVRYIGPVDFAEGDWCGIELEKPLGKNDGSVFGYRYFTCSANYGVMVPVGNVVARSGHFLKSPNVSTSESCAVEEKSRGARSCEELIRMVSEAHREKVEELECKVENLIFEREEIGIIVESREECQGCIALRGEVKSVCAAMDCLKHKYRCAVSKIGELERELKRYSVCSGDIPQLVYLPDFTN